ncbi:MAG: hypothetical protein AAFX03_00760 [Pseudomonadota bacterium]
MWRLIYSVSASCAAALPASAGPWAQAPGDLYTRLVVLGERVEGLTAVRSEFYAEYGLSEVWTATAKAEGAVFFQESEFNQTGYRATLRRQVWKRKTALVAVEAGIIGGEAIGGLNFGCRNVGGEIRVATGISGVNRGRNWFAYADGAGRFHTGGCKRQRMEIGAGREFAKDWYMISQFFFQRGVERGRSDKWEGGVMRRFAKVDIALGVRHEFSGVFRETGVFIAADKRF